MKLYITLTFMLITSLLFAQINLVPFTPNDIASSDGYGISTCVSGDFMIVGSYQHDLDAAGNNYINDAGAAYIFEKNGATWNQVAKLEAAINNGNSDRASQDEFGYSVSISGEVAVVGAHLEDHDQNGGNQQSQAGSAYIYEKIGGNWTFVQKIVAPDRTDQDFFGYSVSVYGKNVLIGAYQEGVGKPNKKAGASYLFTRNGSGSTPWQFSQKITPSQRNQDAFFGKTVSINGDFMLVGAPEDEFDENDGGSSLKGAGAAYFFQDVSGTWTQIAKVCATSRAKDERFGNSVAVSGEEAIVGAYYEDAGTSASTNKAGAAYIFQRSGSGWAHAQRLVASDAFTNNKFGYSVSISGDRAVIGSADKNTGSGRTGGVYIFDRDNAGVWSESYNLIDPNGAANDKFGASVSISAGNMFAGAYQATTGSTSSSGVLYNLSDPSSVVTDIKTVKDGNLNDPVVKDCNCLLPVENVNLVVENQVTVEQPQNLAPTVDVKVDAGGSMDLQGNDMYINGDFDNQGTITNGIVRISNTSLQSVNLGIIDAVEIKNSAGVRLTADATINEVLVLEDGQLDLNGNNLVLKSDATRTAMIVDNGGTISGSVSAQKYLGGANGWHYVTSPMVGQTIADINDDFANAPITYFYDETDPSPDYMVGWVASLASDPIGVGQGVGLYLPNVAVNPSMLVFNGSPRTGALSATVTRTATVGTVTDPNKDPEGWNFIANTYPAPIKFSDFYALNSNVIENSVYVWDPAANAYIHFSNGVSSPAGYSDYIPAYQGFYVRVKNQGSYTLNFNNTIRVTDPGLPISPFYKTTTKHLMRLEFSNQVFVNETVVNFDDNATANFDSEHDAHYLFSESNNAIEVASQLSSGVLAINTLPKPTLGSITTIPLMFESKTNGLHTINLKEFSNFGLNDIVYLVDNKLGITHNLNNGDYSFTHAQSDAPGRFELHLFAGMVSSVDDLIVNDYRVNRSGNQIMIMSPDELNDQHVQVLSYDGRVLFDLPNQMLTKGMNLIDVPGSLNNNQVFLLRLVDNNRTFKFMW